MNKYHIEAYFVVGCHTLVLHRMVECEGEANLTAVEIYPIAPHSDAPGSYHDVNALIEMGTIGDATIAYEGHNFELARRRFCETVISEAAKELETII